MRLLLLGIGLLLTACASDAFHTAGRQWSEVRTARFRVLTEGDVEQARALVLDLERFHQVMLAKTSAQERVGAPPLQILLARDARTLKALTGASDYYAGLFVARVQGNFAFVVLQASEEDGVMSSREVLFHEYTHYIMASAGSRAPSWYQEGFAEYMATTAFRENGAYTLGCPPRYRTRWAQYAMWLPTQKLMEAANIAEHGKHGKIDSYAQAWYAVHFFNQSPAHKQQLAKYLELWASGEHSEQAVERAFGLSYDELNEQLKAYSERDSFECAEIQPAVALHAAEAEVQPLSKADAYYRIGALLLATDKDVDRAQEVLEQALAIEPGHADALGALARVHLVRAKALVKSNADPSAELSAAEGYLRRADALAPGSAERLSIRGHYHALKALVAAAAHDESKVKSEVAAARAAFRKAVHKDEALADAYLGLGASYLILDDGAEEGQVAFEAAAYLVPLESQIALFLAKLHLQREQPALAIPPLQHVLLWGGPEARAEVEELMALARRMAK